MTMTGTVRFFNSAKGFGFIGPDEGEQDVFVHVSALKSAGIETLGEHQRVSFETENDKHGRGPQAVNLAIIDDAPQQ